MTDNLLRDCTICPQKDRPIFIVGPHKFSTGLLAEYIGAKTPAIWKTFQTLQEVPPPDDPADGCWRLIFLDCHDLRDPELLQLLKTEASHLLMHDLIALFNLKRSNASIMGLFNLGVRGFFFNDDPKELLLKGLCTLKHGEFWIPRETMMEYIAKHAQAPPVENPAIMNLTRRERQILTLIASGAGNQQISEQIYVSSHTVKTHIYNIFKKIGVKTRLQAALWAAKHLP